MEIENKNALAELDAQTKLKVAEINSRAEYMRLGIYAEENDEELVHEKLDVEREKLRKDILALDKEFNFKDKELKVKKELEEKKLATQKEIASMKPKTTTTKKKK